MLCGWLAVICMAKPIRPLPVLAGALLPAVLSPLLVAVVGAGMEVCVRLLELPLASVCIAEEPAWKPCWVAKGREEKEAGREEFGACENRMVPAGREEGCLGGRSAATEGLSAERPRDVPAMLFPWPSELLNPANTDHYAVLIVAAQAQTCSRYVGKTAELTLRIFRWCCRDAVVNSTQLNSQITDCLECWAAFIRLQICSRL